MLVNRSKVPTNYILPVIIFNKNNKNYKTNFYYDNEHLLFKAYYQLKKINCNIKPSYPIVDIIDYRNGENI